jgi:hypothetical protein
MATKEDLTQLEARIESKMATMASKDDIVAMESRIIDTITRLIQQKPGE